MLDAETEILLRDYHERCLDFRRQLAYYPRMAIVLVVVVSTSINWVFAEGAFERLWLFPVMVIICQILMIIGMFVYRLHCVLARYLAELETTVDARMPEYLRVHEGQVAFGFHRWRALSYSRQPLYQRIQWGLLGVAAVAAIVFFYMGISSDIFDLWGARIGMFAVALILLATIVSLYVDGYKYYDYSAPERKTDENPYSKEQAAAVLIADYEQRNEDFRRLADFYPQLLIGELIVISGSLGLYYNNPTSKWVFFFAPIGLLVIPIFIIAVAGQVNVVKKYLARLEQALQSLLPSPQEHIHHGYDIGFFRCEREQHVVEAGGRVSIVMGIVQMTIILGVFGFSAYWGWLAYEWLTNLGYGWVSFFHALLLLLLVVFNIRLYLQVRKA